MYHRHGNTPSWGTPRGEEQEGQHPLTGQRAEGVVTTHDHLSKLPAEKRRSFLKIELSDFPANRCNVTNHGEVNVVVLTDHRSRNAVTAPW